MFPTTHRLIQLARQGEGIRREEKGKRIHTLGMSAFGGKKEKQLKKDQEEFPSGRQEA